jgi:hypothetical protein
MERKGEYLDFFVQFPSYIGYQHNQTFEEIYKWLGEPRQIYELINSCDNNRAALEGIARKLESTFGNRTDLNIRENFVKQMIGASVKHVLSFFGYVPTIQ